MHDSLLLSALWSSCSRRCCRRRWLSIVPSSRCLMLYLTIAGCRRPLLLYSPVTPTRRGGRLAGLRCRCDYNGRWNLHNRRRDLHNCGRHLNRCWYGVHLFRAGITSRKNSADAERYHKYYQFKLFIETHNLAPPVKFDSLQQSSCRAISSINSPTHGQFRIIRQSFSNYSPGRGGIATKFPGVIRQKTYGGQGGSSGNVRHSTRTVIRQCAFNSRIRPCLRPQLPELCSRSRFFPLHFSLVRAA